MSEITAESLLSERDFVRALARSLVRDEARADDIAQQAFLAALERPPRSERAVRSWFRSVVRRRIARTWREEANRGRRERAVARRDEVPSAAEILEREEARRRVVDAVLALREPYRSAVVLRYFEDLPPREVARRLGVPVETARTRIKRALAELKLELDREHGGDRRSWVLALLPVAALPPEAAAGSGVVLGALIMSTKMKVAAGVVSVVIVLLAGFLAWRSGDPRTAPEPDRTPPPENVAAAKVESAGETPAPAAVPAEPAPTGLLRVRVTDLSTGREIPEFRCSVGAIECDSKEGVVETRVPVDPDTLGGAVEVTLLEPESARRVSRKAELRADEVTEVLLGLKSGDRILGVVLGPSGEPVMGATVFFGNQIDARGDEPFKPYDMRRIRGATTGEDGSFELAGDGRLVTAWHPDLSPVTIPLAEAARISMPERSSIRGRLLDPAGNPVTGAEVALDRKRKAVTDEEGRFAFDKVQAGVRGLMLPGKRFAGVRVRPGETAEVECGGGIQKVRITLTSDGRPFGLREGRNVGCLVGLDKAFTVHIFEHSRGADAFGAEGVPAGPYLFFTGGGLVAKTRIEGPEAVVDLGTADLTVVAKPGIRVYVIPEDCADEFAQLLGGRVAPRGVPASGEARFAPLPTGRYAVGIDRLGIFATVDVTGPGARVTLP